MDASFMTFSGTSISQHSFWEQISHNYWRHGSNLSFPDHWKACWRGQHQVLDRACLSPTQPDQSALPTMNHCCNQHIAELLINIVNQSQSTFASFVFLSTSHRFHPANCTPLGVITLGQAKVEQPSPNQELLNAYVCRGRMCIHACVQ